MFPNGLFGFIVVGPDGKIRGFAGGGGGGGSAPTDGYWSPITNGDPIAPELIFDDFGDVIVAWNPTP